MIYLWGASDLESSGKTFAALLTRTFQTGEEGGWWGSISWSKGSFKKEKSHVVGLKVLEELEGRGGSKIRRTGSMALWQEWAEVRGDGWKIVGSMRRRLQEVRERSGEEVNS